jgi:uroporphyrinogen-III synthase
MKGSIVITTQPADQAREMLELLRSAGATAYNLPMIRIKMIDLKPELINRISDPAHTHLIIFTSRNGVSGFFENLRHVTGNYNLPQQIQTVVVGKTTARQMQEYGHEPTFLNPGTDAASLADFLINNKIAHGKRILLVLGMRAPMLLQEKLSKYALVNRVDVYETLDVEQIDQDIADFIRQKTTDMCIFTSPSGFRSFIKWFDKDLLKELKFAAIGKTTAAAITGEGYNVAFTSSCPSASIFVIELKGYFKKTST